MGAAGDVRWSEAALAAALVAIDPAALGGVALRAPPGPVRDRWLDLLRTLLPAGAPLRRVPLHIADGRLLGGLDLAATLQAGRPVAERGVLAEADGGMVVLAMAERVTPSAAARIAAVLDTQEVVLERDGLALKSSARLGVIALDEGAADDEQMPGALLERLAFRLDLAGIRRDGIALRDARPSAIHESRQRTSLDAWPEYAAAPAAVHAARARLPAVAASGAAIEALCAAALSLGIASARAPLLALRAACAAAALAGRAEVDETDVMLAARLVLAPRATQLPAAEKEAPETEPPPREAGEQGADPPPQADRQTTGLPLDDLVIAAARAAIPPGLLARLQLASLARAPALSPGRSGQQRPSARRGRPIGVRRGDVRRGRLSVLDTLRAAAPWQRLRRAAAAQAGGRPLEPRVAVRREDFRVTRFKQRTGSTTLFVVDASGSSALHRLAEAKGAVELLLADCYVRRDHVALLAFRGRGAELLLPPTRSLVRAKRSLAELPGGGGTPLAAGIDAAALLAHGIRRKGEMPIVVLLTDGRANIARDGTAGRPRAEEDAIASARALRAAGIAAVLVDTSPQPRAEAARLAQEMGARYLALPHADAGTLSQAVRRAVPQGSAGPAW